QKVGLISTGTKGAAVSRGIAVPEHISKQTEEEIRKMSEEAEADVHMTGDIDAAEKLVLSRVGISSAAKKPQTPASVEMRPQISASNSSECMRGRQSPYGVDNGNFPEVLPVNKTVASLMSSLKYQTKTLYPGRDYLRETHDELLKLVKQNAPRSATPTRLPVFSTITRSGSVRRPLLESFTSEDSDHHSSCDNRRNVVEVVDRGIKGEHSLNLHNEHAYSFNDHISLVPKINFTDINPFQALNGESGVPENRNLPSRGLSSIKRTRDRPYRKIDHNNVQKENEKPEEIESLHHLYNNSRLLEHRRKKVQNEIRTYIDAQKRDRNHDIRNGDLGIKDKFSDLNHFFARRKLEEEEYFFTGNGQHVSKMPKSPVLKAQEKLIMPVSPVLSWEATSLLQANEESNCNREIFEPMDIDTKGAEAVNLLQQNDLLKDRSVQQTYVHPDRQETDYDTTLDWFNRQSRSNSQCSHCSQGSADTISHVQVPTRQPNYMPSFHGNYYTDHMATGDLSWQQKNPRVKVEAMDILDYVDQYIGRDSYMDCRGDRTSTLSVATPDSAGSPVWQASDHILRRKILLPTSPKSPGCPKFYPKKMY
ncbi:uncharacterized protein LOC128553516, partial [Mercenaria mercenaria]|uniref:uncharacterized protein LOC128553516 n=1 Tax=Mercenaria mercenaria TaxID=6596 RepID=UPI00234F6531